jgi:hypothetical protein
MRKQAAQVRYSRRQPAVKLPVLPERQATSTLGAGWHAPGQSTEYLVSGEKQKWKAVYYGCIKRQSSIRLGMTHVRDVFNQVCNGIFGRTGLYPLFCSSVSMRRIRQMPLIERLLHPDKDLSKPIKSCALSTFESSTTSKGYLVDINTLLIT